MHGLSAPVELLVVDLHHHTQTMLVDPLASMPEVKAVVAAEFGVPE